MTYWFGESWGAPTCEDEMHMPTPVGDKCVECAGEINDGDQGFLIPFGGMKPAVLASYHMNCFLRTIIPCMMWTPDMMQDLPDYWREHLREKHGIT